MELVLYHWPRFIPAILFVLFSLMTVRDKYTRLQKFGLGIVLFFISGPIVSIIAELLYSWFFAVLIRPVLDETNASFFGAYTLFVLFYDAIAYIIPLILYSKIMQLPVVISSTWFIQYVLQDRFALIISPTKISYLIVYAVAVILLMMVHKNDVEYVSTHLYSLSWKPVLFYNIALFFLIDSCYCALYFFQYVLSEEKDVLVLWLDGIVILACAFSAGFSKLNVYLSREQSNKIEYMKKFQENQTEIIRNFATISEAKSGETGEHVRRVSEYTAILASELLDNDVDIDIIKIASMLHDVGKLMIPNEIIEKPGKLTDEEYNIIKGHSSYGNELLSHSNGVILDVAREIAHQHHERWDGKGYPQGLKGEEISVYAQIVSVADVYDALTSKRSYKEPWPAERARTEIIIQRGQQFSPKVVDAFDKYYDQIEEIRLKYRDEPVEIK
ncbi:HD domain-containing protein [Pseudobutyrivibrio sp. 49]|uniref:HD-GYP domain-containing protein n=1 Tax=Pseudobutyrivibrio sp. 49 TaxID=1855344 RepID=UPI00087EAD0C|nr:HD domain-containing phosphohydrolase [Pseudobutyrivibrio sp. 49]SDH78804.1 HD domain-containing protein [Pseudobutyrivibrio sp. 49]